MKKIFTLAVTMLAALSASADSFNLFPAYDGWLCFNSQNVINSYVGIINEDDYLVDATGKIVQMVYADQMPDYPPTEADPDIVGAGTDGEIGSEGSVSGALILQPASAVATINGGGFVLALPSCSTLSIDYSSNSRVMARIVATTNPNAPMGNVSSSYELDSDKGWKVISAKYASVFSRLPAGHGQWTGIEKLSNGSDEVTIQSDKPIYVWFQNATRDTVYVHGVKVTTPKQETAGVAGVQVSHKGATEVYGIDGVRLGTDALSGRRHGIFVVRKDGNVRKVMR